MRTLLLFDIDGTLILSGRAGLRALNRAFEEETGVADAFHGINAAGRTDGYLLREAARRAGLALTPALESRLEARYYTLLAEEILLPGEGRKAVMPGVRPLVDALQTRDDAILALLTGNFRTSARIKLEHFDLWHYFECGAFGDDAADRNALVPFAVERAVGCGHPAVAYEDVFVIGDTPHDVACARAVGAVAVAVATGGYEVNALRATGAPHVFEDLSDTEAVLRVVAS